MRRRQPVADHADGRAVRGRSRLWVWLAVHLTLGGIASADGLRERLDDIAERHERYDLSGAVGVVSGDGPAYTRGIGDADRLSGTPNTEHTLFDIGKVTMQFTAAAALRLVMADRLTLDSTLGDLLDEVPRDKRGITIGQLIRHESGMAEVVTLAGAEGSRPERALARLLQEPLTREPGSGYGYSAAGYAMLALVIERVSGEPYREFVRREVFEPSGMKNAHFIGDPDVDATLVAMRYADIGDRDPIGSAMTGRWNWGQVGVTGVVASVNDMLAWVESTRDGAFFNERARDFFWTPDAQGHAPGGMWLENAETGERRVQVYGSSTGFESAVAVFPARDAAIVILLNCNGMLGKIGPDLEQALTARPDAPGEDERVAPTHDRVAGVFRLVDGSRLRIASVDGALIATGTGQRALERLAHGDTFDPSWRRFYDETSARAVECVGLIRAGDAAGLRGMMARDATEADARAIVESLGAVPADGAATALGTVSLPRALSSFVMLGEDDSSRVIVLRWRGRDLIGAEWSRPEEEIRVVLNDKRRGMLEGPSVDGAGELRITFDRDGVEPVRSVKILATRVAPSETAERVE